MPNVAFERGSRAVPVNFRRCRSTVCGDAPGRDFVRRTAKGLPVSAFVHVVDCRLRAAVESEAEGADCSGDRARQSLSPVLDLLREQRHPARGAVAGDEGYHSDDWEGVQIRIRPDGKVDERASSHNGYNYEGGARNWPSDAGIGPLRSVFEAVGIRARNGWGPETRWLFVSGGSHAGNAKGYLPNFDRLTRSGQVHLIPLERIAASGHNPRLRSALRGASRSGGTPKRKGPNERFCRVFASPPR